MDCRPTGQLARLGRSADERAVGPHDEPEASELVDVLAEHLSRTLVGVVVERPTPVRVLAASVAPLGGADQRLLYRPSHANDRVFRDVDRPCVCTRPVAAARTAAAIAGERVEGAITTVEEDTAVARRADAQCFDCGSRRLRRGGFVCGPTDSRHDRPARHEPDEDERSAHWPSLPCEPAHVTYIDMFTRFRMLPSG